MPVSSELNRAQYTSSGETTFNYGFKVLAESDLEVIVTDQATPPVETVQTLNVDYTVTGVGNAAGGTVVFGSATTSGDTITIRRKMTFTQLVDLVTQGGYDSDVVEEVFDRLTMFAQQFKEELARSAKLPVSSSISDLEIPDLAGNGEKYLRANAAGTGLELVTLATTALAVSSFMETVLDDANAGAVLDTLGFGATGKALADDATASDALTTLGVTAFAKTVLDDTTALAARTTLGVLAALWRGPLCPHSGLVVSRQSNTTVDADADSLILTAADGDQKLFTSLDVTLDISGTGGAALGLDTGSEAADTWYYIWAIGKSDGTVSAIFSASSSSPTLPSGYTYKGLIGAVRNKSDGHFRAFHQVDHRCRYSEFGTNALTSGSATTFTAVSFAAWVPAPVRNAWMFVTHATAGFTNLTQDGSGTTAGDDLVQTGSSGGQTVDTVNVSLTSGQSLDYRVTANSTSLTARGWDW